MTSARSAHSRNRANCWSFAQINEISAMKIKYFESAHDFRRWLEKNHATTPRIMGRLLQEELAPTEHDLAGVGG